MMSTALATQQLAEFLAYVSTFPDAASTVKGGVERAARALDAEVAAVIGEYGVVACVGYPAGRVPVAELAEIAAGRRDALELRGAGRCPVTVAPIGGNEPRHLIIARSGDDGFSTDEISLVRGMARVLELTVDNHRTLEAERRQATENARLVATLQDRQRLMEQLSSIQRAITRRAPLQQVLDTITLGARELLGAEIVGLRLRDAEEPDLLILASSCGIAPDAARRMRRTPIAEAGASGQAVLLDDLITIHAYPSGPPIVPELPEVRAVMAAPVHENGVVVGSLAVATNDDSAYGKAEQEVLLAFAEHVSLALTDARTLEAMYEAFHDSLTGLASRRLFMDRLEYGLACAERDGHDVALLFVDLDRFKVVNDSLGHAAGDALLVGVAQRLRASLRASDTAARFGGDEFAVLLHNITEPELATMVAERISAALREPFIIAGKEIFIDSSIGIAFGEPGGPDAEALVQRADLAMYQAKKNGKGRFEQYDPAMQVAALSDLDLEADLHRAVQRGEFVLRYQPIVRLSTEQVTGLEALVRWAHPERGMIAPMDFIPLAEETGLIVPIGRWVLHEACRQASEWNAARPDRPLTISVNLSARQLQQTDLATMVAGALDDSGLAPGCLVLEITESLLVRDPLMTAQRLRELKALGVRLAVDDFGTGYSSLAYLQQFPVDILKIDKSFVDGLADGGDGGALTLGIVRLGQSLRLSTVAEGIEDSQQHGELRDGGCDLGQGYLFAKPLDVADVAALL